MERHCCLGRKRPHRPEGSSWPQVTTQTVHGTAPCGNPAGMGRSWCCLLLPQNCDRGLCASGHSWAFGDSPSCSWGKILTVIHAQLAVLWADGMEQRRKIILLGSLLALEKTGFGLVPTPNNTTDTSIVWRGPTGCGGQGVITLLDPGTGPQQGQASKSVRFPFPEHQHPPQSNQRARSPLGKWAGR